MTDYIVTFERIGRRVRDLSVPMTAGDADDLAENVYRFARKHLASKGFEVTVDLETMRGAIEYGRFGTFTVALAVPA